MLREIPAARPATKRTQRSRGVCDRATKLLIAGAETVFVGERNMSDGVMRGIAHPAGVEEHITREGIVSEPGRSRVWPASAHMLLGPHREGEEP